MKSKYIYPIFSVAILAVALFYYSNNDGKTETTTSTEVTDKESVSSTLTLASLEAREDWNPTMEIEGMVRVEDGVSSLEVEKKEVTLYTNKLFNSPELLPFEIKQLEYIPEDFFCEKLNVTKKIETLKGEMISPMCLPYPPEDYNEFIIISGDTEEVLHKFRYEDGYSIATAKLTIPYSTVVSIVSDYELGNPVNSEYFITFEVAKWSDFTTKDEADEVKSYNLNLLTGEIIQE